MPAVDYPTRHACSVLLTHARASTCASVAVATGGARLRWLMHFWTVVFPVGEAKGSFR